MILPIIGVLIGVAIGLLFPLSMPVEYSKYLAVALLASLDSVFGGLRSVVEKKYDNQIFISGFFVNALLAAGLAYIGERLCIDLYYVALIAFGMRIFQNLAIIRRALLGK